MDILWGFITSFVLTFVQAEIFFSMACELRTMKNEKFKALYYTLGPLLVYLSEKILTTLSNTNSLDMSWNVIWYVVTLSVYALCMMAFLKGGFLKNLITMLLCFASFAVQQSLLLISLFIVLKLDYKGFTSEWSPLYLIFCTTSYTTHYIITRLLIAAIKSEKPKFPIRQVLLIAAFDVSFISLALVTRDNLRFPKATDTELHGTVAWTAVSVALIAVIACFYIVYDKKITRYRFDLEISRSKLEEQRRRMEDIKEQELHMRKIRHDYRNHILTGLALIKDGRTDRAETYFSEYLDYELSGDRVYVNTENDAVNAIINKKLTDCFNMGVDVSIEAEEEIGSVPEIDLCVVLFNLFDNAVAECSKNPKKSKLEFKLYREKAYIVVSVGNTVCSSVLEDNSELKTTKSDKINHGIGLSTVKEICQKYDGIFQASEKDGMFYAEAWLISW